MLTFLYILQFIIAFILIFCIFLQRKEETTSLLSSNSYNSMFKSMAVPANPLIKITLIVGVLFFLNSILIGGILLKRSKTPSQLIEKVENLQKTMPTSQTNPANNPASTINNAKLPNKDTVPAVPLGNTN